MGEKIVIGPINRGLTTNREAFVIDNDSFPVLINAYQWRGRVKRKRGTSLLCRLRRFFNSANASYSSNSTFVLDGSGIGNILVNASWTLQINGSIFPGSVIVTAPGPNVFTDQGDGTFLPSGSINYATGVITIAAEAGNAVSAQFNYFPDLPVMGLRDFVMASSAFPGTLGFDTVYAYNILTTNPYTAYDVSFYKNPSANPVTLPGYIAKTTITPTTWNGQDYQQFWTVNYQGALWATNGITVPFNPSTVGMQFKLITNITMIVAGPPATARLTIAGHGLVVGDFLFINEVLGVTGINGQTGYVINVVDANNVDVEFPNATLGGAYASGGMAQYLTNRSDVTKDCIRWYDGDPTDGNTTTPTLTGQKGWVNFAPPLSQLSYSIAEKPPRPYYLVGARIILPFKDRLLFIGPVIQASTGSPLYLQDTVIYSQNGTPYYTSSFTGDPTLITTTQSPILVPDTQTASVTAYWEDQTGFGGFAQAGIDEPINTTASNEDVLVMGMDTNQLKFVFTGDDLQPFVFYIINSELGSSSTFTAVNFDEGVMARGNRGYTICSQTQTSRIDLPIPDQVFQVSLTNNGTERMTSQRDYINEWIYFTYPSNQRTQYKFPNQTLQYNYRDESWAVFDECYTTYGQFKIQTGYTWATIGKEYPTWGDWNATWGSGASTLLQPDVIAGNQQGFVALRDQGTGERPSLYIKNISFPVAITGATNTNPVVLTANNTFIVGQTVTITGVQGMTQLNGNTYPITAVTPTTITISVNGTAFGVYSGGGIATPPTIYSPDHTLNVGDYIIINGALGTVGANVNGKIFSVSPTVNTNEFYLNPLPDSGTYIGNGLITRLYVPKILTKQFPVSWGMARKTRLGPQQYLLSRTAKSQLTLLIYLSQNDENPYNDGPIVPEDNSINNSLVYSTVLYTCPESTNLGLTPANINLQTPTAGQQAQIWHRMNTSLIGDTVQIGFTLNDAQMREVDENGLLISQDSEIELHGIILDVNPSQLLV